MSQGRPIRLADANPIAQRLHELLRPACERVAIAGSIRRAKPLVADIELVAMPLVEEEDGGDLWGTPVEVDRLNILVGELRAGRTRGGWPVPFPHVAAGLPVVRDPVAR